MVLKGVGAAIMNPKAIGMFIGKKELSLMTQGIYSFVSGWIAVLTTDCIMRNSFTSWGVVVILESPVIYYYKFSANSLAAN